MNETLGTLLCAAGGLAGARTRIVLAAALAGLVVFPLALAAKSMAA